MKRQPIGSAAVFFVLPYVWVESGRGEGENVAVTVSSTDGIFCANNLYWTCRQGGCWDDGVY